MCAALPGFHAYTGSDYTSAFVRRGKIRPLALLEKNEEAQVAFAKIASSIDIAKKTKTTLESFTASMYGAKRENVSLNAHRWNVVERPYGPRPGAKKICWRS